MFLTRSHEGHEESAHSFSYNTLGQLRAFVSSCEITTFAYDALGNRLVSGDRLWIPDHADPLKRPLIEADATTGEPRSLDTGLKNQGFPLFFPAL